MKTKAPYYTPQDYLELEENSQDKHEYRDGEIIPMAGGTTNHNKIALNLCRQFPLSIGDIDYEVYLGDVKLWIPAYRQYTYPDVMVIEGQPMYHETGTTAVINPTLIVEVLSNSTRNYDQGDKFDGYRSLPQFRDYLLICQYQYHVKHFSKTSENQWLLTEYRNLEDEIQLRSIEFRMSLAEIYRRVNLQESE
ncbi:Uma2 family endonuclease [Sodalinema gerasimenkoae]|uniref:Uma2 family endonuclease n=1 Tax=Sodalinema gerasimenkoae TaxID=2862348 RepID=UPI00135B4393|nr:Uma2 family endonuclease [Sodalinema gerasimenkoae]